MNVAVLGASARPDRYSNKAIKLLLEKGHKPFPVRPALKEIDGIRVYPRLVDIEDPIHTLTVYLSAANSTRLQDDIVKVRPLRVILNPGAENPQLKNDLQERGVDVLEACTLVLLKTGQF